MYVFDRKSNNVSSSHGGYSQGGQEIRDTYVQIERGPHGILYQPAAPGGKGRIAVVVVHPEADYITHPMGGELAKRGYTVYCGQVKNAGAPQERKLDDIKSIVCFLRALPGIEKVVLMGHSGGASMMSAYQAIAENGASIFQGSHMLADCTVRDDLPAADGLMILDSNWGNGAMTLLSVDPAVRTEGDGRDLDPQYDIFDPAVGYDPAGASYTKAFLTDFLAAQRERNNKLVMHAVERLHAIESGHGLYDDDEPLILTGAAQMAPCNKLLPEDIHLLAHTKGSYTLLHSDGSGTTQVIRSLRKPWGSNSPTPRMMSTVVTTVRSFLSEHAVLAKPDYFFHEDCITGIDWDSTCNCTPGNVKHISAPMLCMGMTGSFEYLAAEEIYHNAASTDKEIAFVEGASHRFTTEESCEEFPGQFGDTQKTLYDYVDRWLSKPGRFFD